MIKKYDMKKIYVLTAYRWGRRDNHSYVLAASSSRDSAIRFAEEHCNFRGGKYSIDIDEVQVGLFDNEAEEYSNLVYTAKGHIIEKKKSS